MAIKWVISSLINIYQRRNRVGRLGFIFSTLGILGVLQRTLVQAGSSAFGGVPAALFVIGVLFTMIGWVLSLIYPRTRL